MNLWICGTKLLLPQEIVLQMPNNYTHEEISNFENTDSQMSPLSMEQK